MKIKFLKNDIWFPMNWKITISLDIERKIVKVEKTNDNCGMVFIYPMRNIKKIFKLMILNISSEELNEIQEYLNTTSKKHADLFRKMRKKGR